MRTLLLASIVWALAVSPITTEAAEAPAMQHPAMELFLDACAIPYTHLELVLSEMRRRAFTEVQGADLQSFQVGGRPHRAWRGTIQGIPLVVALAPETMCTVFVHAGDGKQIQAVVESWLPSTTDGIAVKRSASETRNGTTTTLYELPGGKVREQWVVTISQDPASRLKALLSWAPLPAA